MNEKKPFSPPAIVFNRKGEMSLELNTGYLKQEINLSTGKIRHEIPAGTLDIGTDGKLQQNIGNFQIDLD